MRKVIIIALAIFAFQALSAQEARFGLTASPEFNFATIKAENVDNSGIRLGLNYGLLADFTLGTNERYAFSTGITHRLTGYNLTEEYTDSTNFSPRTDDATVKLQYIEIPLTMRLRTNEIGYITYYGQFGLVPGVMVSSRLDQESTLGNDAVNFEDRKIGEDAKFFNVSLHFGAGLEYSLGGATALMGGIYYNNGFLNTYDPQDEANPNNGEIAPNEALKLSNFGLRIGVLF